MYTNQTATELELFRCTSSGILEAMNSIWIKINFFLSTSIILLTFFASIYAVRVLKFHNVYSSGTQFLLFSLLISVNFNQMVYLVIQVRLQIQIWKYSDDPCQIEFPSTECYYDNSLYMFTSYLVTWLVFSLTFDRFLAFCLLKLYSKPQISRNVSKVLVGMSLIFTFIGHILVYGGVSRAGYVPTCQYPPQLALGAFQKMTHLKIVFTILNCVVILILLCFIVKRDRRICHSIYDTNTRYSSFENVLTTKSILVIAVTHLIFSCLSSVAVTIARAFEIGLSEYTFHTMTQFIAGPLYGNLSIPVLIYRKTSQCIEYRRKTIIKLTTQADEVDSRMMSLKKMWE
ncbi:G-protein coupled receptors family 1 profile domain-containing protein [Caenorhabditis elegans]|uniref:G-protein coupled receptors family 1 profile domain-containing protein n=1 Tax=Caenorhabditis elegans TaxID=6239 RepID=Q9XW96_CAEEL|nr:G-protein coupled receptors family 1 profile domain-containing protein [Caenorhabditis elegans]CAA22070.3 G-protein coupled receptors family 1 profile domain-containing protein [Caenorhabditis elegans]|eukprot:NP_502833.3 Serpentine Receptor, class A (alpha) [Caenorhabditis elegans]